MKMKEIYVLTIIFISFFSSRKFELSEGTSLRGTKKMVRENECSSYLELSGVRVTVS